MNRPPLPIARFSTPNYDLPRFCATDSIGRCPLARNTPYTAYCRSMAVISMSVTLLQARDIAPATRDFPYIEHRFSERVYQCVIMIGRRRDAQANPSRPTTVRRQPPSARLPPAPKAIALLSSLDSHCNVASSLANLGTKMRITPQASRDSRHTKLVSLRGIKPWKRRCFRGAGSAGCLAGRTQP